MSTITAIDTHRGRVTIYADGIADVRVRCVDLERFPLKVGDEVDLEAWRDRVASKQFGDAWEAALGCLDRSARTAREIQDALKRRGFLPGVADLVIERLKETGLIDDARYAGRLAELQSQRPVGIYAIRRKLKARGISQEDAEEALQAFDEAQQAQACLQAGRQLFKKYEALPPRQARGKLAQALSRRGFSWSAIEGAVEAIVGEGEEP